MDWIDELIYPKLSLKKEVLAPLQLDQFPSSPYKQLDATVGSNKDRRQIDDGKNCLAIGRIYTDAAVSPNLNPNLEKRNAALEIQDKSNVVIENLISHAIYRFGYLD